MRQLPILLLLGAALVTAESSIGIAQNGDTPGIEHPDALGFVIPHAGRRILLPSIADTHLWKGTDVGSPTTDNIALRDNRFSQGLVRVDLKALPAKARLDAAVFHCRVRRVERTGLSGRIHLHRVLVPWTEDASWKAPSTDAGPWNGMKPGRDFSAEPFAAISVLQIDAGQVIEIPDVGSALEQWRSGSWADHGVLVLFDGPALQIHISTREAMDKRPMPGR